MAKSNYLLGILLLIAVSVHFGVAGNIVGKEYQVSRTKNQDQYQVSGIKYQDLGPLMGSVGFSNFGSSHTSYFTPPKSDVKKRVKNIYDSQIGVREVGVNRGPDIEKYLCYVEITKASPWCAAFVCWVLGQARINNPRSGWSPDLFGESVVIWRRNPVSSIKNQESKLPHNAPYSSPSSLATCLPDRQAGNRQLLSPGTGDVFGIYFPEKKRIAHVGFVDEWEGSWLITVEGNTNISGDREGDGVYRKRRLVRSIYRVARYN